MENNTSFYCLICDKNITTGEDQYLHFEKHIDIQVFNCQECNKQFKQEKEFEEHLALSNHKKRPNLILQKFITFLCTLSPQMEHINETDIRNYRMLLLKENKSKSMDVYEDQKTEDNLNDIYDGNEYSTDRKEIKDIQSQLMHDDKNERIEDEFVSIYSDSNLINEEHNNSRMIKKMSNCGLLDLRALADKVFIKSNNIVNKCNICRTSFHTPKDKITHIFMKHLKLKTFAVLKCSYCLKSNKKSNNFIDFSSVFQHYKSSGVDHLKMRYQNNLNRNYKGNEEFIQLNAKYDTLYRYENEFKKCFVLNKI
ncbi:Zinc finger, C2H2 domain and Zinc finger, C2H2-like domain-containing protein [Strongyloides ratti]|uniref:Zinc finger, C2H2 domain and Zinc finger, C2H2-like domain-containing protein n=1 Tax=Strongyloides ratti TaxID=34506 RepID=A0A090L920_STRRB|nr:Zinc finger, C2H2 domain and Zinc finger, C2H2-like domain-containing protein [Strongyloides ratti]CEF64025.1 Zinc finger, C2H2 domain and Zinc finger, C2H2-like domain-containing protein [Strongyloides ratti]